MGKAGESDCSGPQGRKTRIFMRISTEMTPSSLSPESGQSMIFEHHVYLVPLAASNPFSPEVAGARLICAAGAFVGLE
jgi:hypothetical protein